jgi:NAD(P)-dependent dehydrogenase (short-subunit alcohol dehydrogenase family)
MIARALRGRGAEVATAGRDVGATAALAADLGSEPIALEITDPDSCEAAVAAAVSGLGGLDAVVIATGAVAFGRSGELPSEIESQLLAVNASGPISLIAAALPHLSDGGGVVALTAVVAEFPTAGMAAYSASKAALSAYLTALRRERRRELGVVLDVRPGHMDTGFADSALAGEPPKLPPPQDPEELVEQILLGLEEGKRELRYDPRERRLLLD